MLRPRAPRYAPGLKTFQRNFCSHPNVTVSHVFARLETLRAGRRNSSCQPLMTGGSQTSNRGNYVMTKFTIAAFAVVAAAVSSATFAAAADLMSQYYIGR